MKQNIFSKEKLAAKIISIGDELIRNQVINTNSIEISSQLESLGIAVHKIVVVGDCEEHIIEEIRSSSETILLLTGGLGPTQDDRTVSAVAKACRVGVETNSHYQTYLKSIRRDLPKNFLKQAIVPQGFVVEKNPYGTAPFIYQRRKVAKGNCLLILLPGVPFECISLFKNKVIPLIKKNLTYKASQSQYQEVKIISVPESVVEEHLEVIRQNTIQSMNRRGKNKVANDDLQVSFLPSLGELLVRLQCKNPVYLKTIARKLLASLPNHCGYMSSLNQSIQSVGEKLHWFFTRHKWKVGFAESCTGGLLTSHFVAFPGSSKYLDVGVVTYSNHAKINFCNVKLYVLKKFGAVSPETAQEMVIGLSKKRKLNLCVSITGIAGPSGGTVEKPVGLVYLGLYYHPPGRKTPFIAIRKLNLLGGGNFFSQSRNRIRERAMKQALFFMLEVCLFKKIKK